jgi:hypothetical protein
VTSAEEFIEFATVTSPRLRHTALVGASGVITFATATNTPGKPIPIDGVVVAVAVAPRP